MPRSSSLKRSSTKRLSSLSLWSCAIFGFVAGREADSQRPPAAPARPGELLPPDPVEFPRHGIQAELETRGQLRIDLSTGEIIEYPEQQRPEV